jgi:hypothetical protein
MSTLAAFIIRRFIKQASPSGITEYFFQASFLMPLEEESGPLSSIRLRMSKRFVLADSLY